ncbi:MAG: DJ-1/PfpI family protein [Anaerolineae bacterium]|nr:DJ-1/PfpI family protein [Anaerolineae bacterium]
MARHVLITLFDDVDTLDFAGPLEVFAITGQRMTGPVPFTVSMVAERDSPPINTRSGLMVLPYYTYADPIQADILVIPGGLGARHESKNPAILHFIKQQAEYAEIIMSVCSGALLLGACGLLDGLDSTTHHAALEELARIAPKTNVIKGRRFVDNGKVITSAGITAGLDASLYVVQRLLGPDIAQETANHLEYSWQPAGPS